MPSKDDLRLLGFYSEFGQDLWLSNNVFRDTRNGVFLDIGAHNGIDGSNTYHFEKNLGWTGVCVEPIPRVFEQLQKNRRCSCVNSCVADVEGSLDFIVGDGESETLSGLASTAPAVHLERIQDCAATHGDSVSTIKINTISFSRLCAENGLKNIDLLSIDTEGAELRILKSIDFIRYPIHVVCVENNYHGDEIACLLETNGYELRAILTCDEIYVKKKMIR